MTDSVESSRATGRRRRLVMLLAGAFVVVLAAASLLGTWVLGVWGPDSDPAASPTASPTPTGPPSPFAGTPAEDFAEGAAGIVLPPAEPVGDFAADQVADALEQVRDALIAARLDQAMLVDHDPDRFLAALAPDHQAAQEKAFDSAAFAEFASQVGEDVQLAVVAPRVAGTISYRATTAERDLAVIEVTTRFAWVYAFEALDDEHGGDLVVVRDELVWLFRQGHPWAETSHGLWLADEVAQVWGADCDTYEAGWLSPGAETVAGLTEQAEAIFGPEQPLDAADGC